jgi:hypothetical protein
MAEDPVCGMKVDESKTVASQILEVARNYHERLGIACTATSSKKSCDRNVASYWRRIVSSFSIPSHRSGHLKPG